MEREGLEVGLNKYGIIKKDMEMVNLTMKMALNLVEWKKEFMQPIPKF